MLENTPNQPTKFRTKNRVEINYESHGTCITSNTYSNAYILAKGTITVANTAATEADANNTDKKVIFKNCPPSTSCISRINNTQIDDAQYIDVVMPMYNLIEYKDDYSKTSGILFQCNSYVPAVDNNGAVTDFTEANVTDSFNLKVKLTGQTGNNYIKNVEIMYH